MAEFYLISQDDIEQIGHLANNDHLWELTKYDGQYACKIISDHLDIYRGAGSTIAVAISSARAELKKAEE